MKLRKHLWVATSALALFSKQVHIIAQDNLENWMPRNVDQVIEELEYDENNQVTYTIQYGDTLGVIAEALKIESYYLAQINHIEDVDLIFPGNVITAQLDANHQASSLSVAAESGEIYEIDVPVNLSIKEEAIPSEPLSTEDEMFISPELDSTQPLDSLSVEEDQEEEVNVSEEDVSHVEVSSSQYAAFSSALPLEAPNTDSQTTVPLFTVTENSKREETMPSEEVTEEASNETTLVTEISQETELAPSEPEVVEGDELEYNPIEADTPEEIQEEVYEEVVEPFEDVVSEAPAVVEGDVPEYNPIVTDIPEEIHEEVYEEVVEPSEDVVNEDPEVVEEIIATPESPDFDPMANPQNVGLQPNVAAFKEEVASTYGVDAFSLYRPGDAGDHGSGLAVDFMVPVGSALGDEIANHSINTMSENNISYVIWKQAIYGDWSHEWETMEDRGSVTANHYDHVHVSFNGN